MPPRHRHLKTTLILSDTRHRSTRSSDHFRQLQTLWQKQKTVPSIVFAIFLATTIVSFLHLFSSHRRSCSSIDAVPYKSPRKRPRAVVLGPGVAHTIHLRVLLERLSGYVTTSGGLTAYCLHDKCPPHESAIATFLEAENLHLADPQDFDRVVAIARSPLEAIYIEAVLANAANDLLPKIRINLAFASFHIKSYQRFVEWVSRFPTKLVRLDDLAEDEASGGEKGVWVELAHFLDVDLTEKALARQAKCAFKKEGIQSEHVLQLVPRILYGKPVNKTQFTKEAWGAVSLELVRESCTFGFKTAHDCETMLSS